jgi:hypothetical protein
VQECKELQDVMSDWRFFCSALIEEHFGQQVGAQITALANQFV